ncbi:aspartate aminotransferase family protein, partial [Streptomyces rimosus]|uniref:aspartate aminotransferase family protein n=1 Tax=Streptomyces rimosus TaxID=1927 RepID=UPI0012FF579B
MADLSRQIAQRIEAAAGTANTEQPAAREEPAAEQRQRVHGPRVTVARASGMVGGSASEAQQAHLDDLVRRYTAKTATSKEIAQRYRRVLADSRAVVGFRSKTKEMLYPIAGRRARGSWLEDVDGNRYVDITMGFGVLLFGHEPEFVSEAVREHLSRGIQLGPRNVETGEAAELLAELTGMQRVAFANSGTEANSAAIRLARAATGRSRIVTFHGAYHGHADNVLGRSTGTGADRTTVPVSTGIPHNSVADLLVLDYGSPASLEAIAAHADDIAAVIIEPVQSRHPSLQPVEFVRQLRELTRRHGIVLMFDEMLTGFRPAPRGAQELYGVTPDLATYGKLLGGGFPIGAIAGRADIMDGVDGGFWQYGAASYPPADTTFFGGTYIQHPVSMVAARAVLTHLKEHSPRLQERLNARTGELAGSLNRFLEDEEFPLRVSHFGSQFRFEHRADMELLYHHLMLRGVHVWEWRNFFLSTAHSDGDIECIADAVRGSLRELRGAGFFPGGPKPAPVAPKPVQAAPKQITAPAPAPRP